MSLLSADQAEEFGLDSTGRDGNSHFPYTTENAAAGQRERVLDMASCARRGLPVRMVPESLQNTLRVLVMAGQLLLLEGGAESHDTVKCPPRP